MNDERAVPATRRFVGALFVVGQLALLAMIAFGPRRLGPEWKAPWSTVALTIGLGLALVGGLLALAAAIQLGRYLTPFPTPAADSMLVQSGAYRFVRHPIYCGLISMAFGWALIVHGDLTLFFACALFALLDAKSRYEERLLVAKFDDYAGYRRRVRRLVPFLY